jgi:hypothetical protein
VNHSPILLGTSSFTATGWQGSFYPKGLRPADYLSYYAQHFDTVEIDSTFYATPNVSVVRSWNDKTPEGFLFAAKVPQEITHKRVLKDCDEEFKVFLTTMEVLGEKLGPLLFQFGKFDKTMFRSLDDFLGRLVPFLKRLPKEHKFAVEIRNKDWLVPKLADVLREHGVALPGANEDLAVLSVSGRLQWLTLSRRWRFFPEPISGESALGLGKISSPQAPYVSEIRAKLESRRIQSCWDWLNNLSDRIGAGWEIFHDDDGRFLRYLVAPSEQIFVIQQPRS